MVTNVTLNSEKFNSLLRCFISLKEVCNDVDIRSGIIRQRSNDKTSIFEVDMTPLFNGDGGDVDMTNINIAISDIKSKLDLLKAFSGQDINLEIVGGENSYFVLSDQFSSVKFVSPALQFMDNKYMNEEQLEAIFKLDEEDLILEHPISNMITDRIKVITTSFHTDVIQVNFRGEEAVVTAATQAKDQFAKIITGITTNIIINNCTANLSNIPFTLDHDTVVDFKMYKDPNQDVSLNKFVTTIGDVTLAIFTRSSIISDE
jgi:hypothetical protein